MPARILIVEESPVNRSVIASRLAAEYFEVVPVSTGTAAHAELAVQEPDLILLDPNLSDMDGFALCRLIKEDPATAHVPILILSSLSLPAHRLEGLSAGAAEVLVRPVPARVLLARIRSLLRAKAVTDELGLRAVDLSVAGALTRPTRQDRVALISRDAATAEEWMGAITERLRADIRVAPGLADLTTLWSAEGGARADAILIHHDQRADGRLLRAISRLKARRDLRDAAILVTSPAQPHCLAPRALDLGANDCLVEPFLTEELVIRLRAQLNRKRQIDLLRRGMRDCLRLAVTDPLTGLFNRRYFERNVDRMVEQARRRRGPLTIMMLDLDRFKSVNDRFGHGAGDAVLCQCARRLTQNLRSVDLLARLGGEEFCVALPGLSNSDARAAAERLRAAIEQPGFSLSNGHTLSLTVSIGVASASWRTAEPTRLMEEADAALYLAKNAGRNTVSELKLTA